MVQLLRYRDRRIYFPPPIAPVPSFLSFSAVTARSTPACFGRSPILSPLGWLARVSWSAIAGPSIAGEVAARRDTCVVFAGHDEEVLEHLAGAF
ncbi:MAG: hypothetical protein LC751_02680 [Actinobacteria bacterium]|nr:hypothetical protein [Actinomycetota bacterium]